MKRQEVLSVAVGKTSELIKKHNIHACPHNLKGYRYREFEYITFRKRGGGEMDTLYEVDTIIVLNPDAPRELEILAPECRSRLLKYIEDRRRA